ncbi:hypothetical protein R9C00_28630 [Flammeovirgaceae bacterium SG7u.111]|nr:hypothetical protein [Flammeovirgaceae bacterium SG7u.132]WPO35668.1 hypothetical protein R9C00_28630 [Flammeovirgaceae bacterium SG7u.111]
MSQFVSKSLNVLWIAMLSGLVLFNVAFFSLKNCQVVASVGQRSPQIALEFVQKNIPKGSKVVGEPMFFYAVTEAGSEYQYYDLYESLEERERKHREEWGYDYLIVTQKSYAMRAINADYYLSKAELEEVARLELRPNTATGWFTTPFGLPLLSKGENVGYSSVLYKRVKLRK